MSRPHGSKNQPKRAIIRLLDEKFPGWNPLVQLAETANDASVDRTLRDNAAREVAQYITPKLKAIEVENTGQGTDLAGLLREAAAVAASMQEQASKQKTPDKPAIKPTETPSERADGHQTLN